MVADIQKIGINTPDHNAQFTQIASKLSENRNNFVALLQSKDCNGVKAMMKTMIEQFLSIDAEALEAEEAEQQEEEGEDEENDHEVEKDLVRDKGKAVIHMSETGDNSLAIR